MPAASIVNGRTGDIRQPTRAEIDQYVDWLVLGGDPQRRLEDVVSQTLGRRLHVCEFWLPGDCNLRCTHCYVASRKSPTALSAGEYAKLVTQLVRAGLIDVVIPGMEPLTREELWTVLEAAAHAGARSIGITTNGTLLARNLDRLSSAPLTVINVSLDGGEHTHDAIRGQGVFKVVENGIRALRLRSKVRIITNTTLNRSNLSEAAEIAHISRELGADYAAFHPFETSAEIDNAQAVTASEVAKAYESVLDAFCRGQTGSVVLETEASTFDSLLEFIDRGHGNDLSLASDEVGFLFLRKASRCHEALVSLMGYPHHFIHTIRVADNGGISSCRNMAQTDWNGIGDLRKATLSEHFLREDIRQSLGLLWSEFRRAVGRARPGGLDRFLTHLPRHQTDAPAVAPAAALGA